MLKYLEGVCSAPKLLSVFVFTSCCLPCSFVAAQIPSGGTSLDILVKDLTTKNASAQNHAPAESKDTSKVYHCKPGPWGNVEYYYIYLEAPEELVDRFPMPNTVPRWCFPGWTSEQMTALFDKAALPKAFQDILLAKGHSICEDGILSVFPPVEYLEAMTQEQREIIYPQLAQYEQNEFHQSPVNITSDDVDDWLRGSSISEALAAKVKKFIYKRGDALLLSDLRSILSFAKDDAEAHSFFKLITRTRSLIAHVNFERADLKAVTAYWTGPGQRNKDILPMLESVASTEGSSLMEIAHLLPALPRKSLYTFPSPDMGMLGRIPDCHWTSLNFFNYYPKDYYLDTKLAADHLLTNYDKVEAPFQFGDVFMFMDGSTGSALHSCVFVADDIVYTKNGDNLVTPWVLMKLEDVKKIYFHANSDSVQAYRIKAPTK